MDQDRDTGKTYLGGDMHCPSASSFLLNQLSVLKMDQQTIQILSGIQHCCKCGQVIVHFSLRPLCSTIVHVINE